jgi:hypothetical protein
MWYTVLLLNELPGLLGYSSALQGDAVLLDDHTIPATIVLPLQYPHRVSQHPLWNLIDVATLCFSELDIL